MDDFGVFARDLGYRPQGKAAPMKSTLGSDAADRSRNRSSAFTADDQNGDGLLFNDVFGGPPKYSSSTNNSSKTSGMSDFDYDSVFKNSAGGANEPKSKSTSSSSTLPVYDKPVYDDDIFDGLPGIKSKSISSSSAKYGDNVFASMVSPPKRSQQNDHFDDLLGNLGKTEKAEPKSSSNSKSQAGFDDLLPGFGSGNPAATNRSISEPSQIPKKTSFTKEASSNVLEDPFVVLESTSNPGVSSPGLFTDPLEEISKLSKPESAKAGSSSTSGGVFDDIDPLNGFGKSAPVFSNENNRATDRSPIREGSTTGRMHNSTNREPFEKTSSTFSETHSQKKVPVDDFVQSHKSPFDMPSVSRDSQRSFDQTASPPSYANYTETVSQVDASPRAEEYEQPSDDIWLTVAEIPLFTQPTRAPPPSRPPPPIPRHTSRSERGSFASNSRRKGSDFSSSPNSIQYSESPRPFQPTVKSPVSSTVDDLENFAMGRMHKNAEEPVDIVDEEMDSNSAAAAMKEAMDRAEAKFRHAKEVREREHAKAARNKETAKLERDEETMEESWDGGELREKQERLEQERRQREKEEEEERERRRLEKERAREIEREKARQAVERATREARERAATEARERAQAEARLKSERAAVQRAQAEARERAAVGARERAERAAVEARERAAAEARERVAAETREKEASDKAAVARAEADARRRAQRAAVDRVAAQARERAAADAQERAAAAAAATRMNQQKNDNDLESFFSMNSRPSSAPRPRASSSDPASDPHSQSRGGPEGPRNTSSSGVSSNMRKASSATNIVDDLSSIFGAGAPSGGFPDVEGETEERRRARLERHQRTQDRAAKALAEKNQRDLQTLREQEERHRIGDTLDSEIKRWSAGKEGNLRALLSTLQYVLWPECGWQPVSLTDLIMGASVKKAYRKATLCIHPDKVQQKGANLQQKYVAEKVFDLLKEAWNKFNSEELF